MNPGKTMNRWWVVLGAILMVVLIGLVSSLGIIQQRPATYLRQQNGT